MSAYPEIRATLEVSLNNIVGLPEVNWENTSTDPTTGSSFLRVQFIPTSTRPAVRGLNPQQRYQGIFRVFVSCPTDAGPKEADDLADTILDAFAATTDLTHNSTTVSIDYAERGQGIPDGNWYYIVCDIGWYHYAA